MHSFLSISGKFILILGLFSLFGSIAIHPLLFINSAAIIIIGSVFIVIDTILHRLEGIEKYLFGENIFSGLSRRQVAEFRKSNDEEGLGVG